MTDFSFVNLKFTKILPDRTNLELFNLALDIEIMRELIVNHLKIVESTPDGHQWWEERLIINLCDSLYESGCIFLPIDPVEKLRWIALLSIACAQREGFSYGNVLTPPDYLPDDRLEDWEDCYGFWVIEDIRNLRKKLKEEGWKKVFA